MTTATDVAKERQLDWLLDEVLGSVHADRSAPSSRALASATRPRWLAAALLTLAVGAAFGVALLRRDAGERAAQDPSGDAPWHEAHGQSALASVPADVVSLRCFDFDDAALAQLPRFQQLERLDLSGTDVNDRGYAVSLQITDAGIAHLGVLPRLRWLSLATCHQVKGDGLRALEQVPLLEHLDLTYSGVESPAVERLALLGSLRELSLSHCRNFHGRSLAEVAKIPGLRRLDLQGCVTLSSADAMHLGRLTQLRHLDLRDCQGRFRGQTASGFSTGGEEPPPPPAQDGIGITDANVAALAKLPLQTLLLGGSESLTDAIGETLAQMTTLRHLDLSNLPKTTGALLAQVPPAIESLALDHNRHLGGDDLRRLPALTSLRELGLSDLDLADEHVREALAGRRLTSLRLAGWRRMTLRTEPEQARRFQLTAKVAETVAMAKELERLDLSDASWVEAAALPSLATLPRLRELDLTGASVGAGRELAPLAQCRALRSLKLVWCKNLDLPGLRSLVGTSLQELDLYGTNLKDADVREVAKAWPGCRIKMPKGQLYCVP